MYSGNQPDPLRCVQQITSRNNSTIREILSLRNHRDREETGLFLIEGFRELSRAVAIEKGQQPIEFCYVCFCKEFFLGENELPLLQELSDRGVPLIEVPNHLFEKISYRDRPDGLLAVAKQWSYTLEELSLKLKKKSSAPLLLVAEAIEKPGNLGTILRSADAAGVDGILLCDEKTDLFNPNVVRASTGMLFALPIIRCSAETAWEWLRAEGISIISATPAAEKEFTQVDLEQPIAIAVGTEQYGLSPLWMEKSSINVRIPMLGIADSLNVATATTLLLYESIRQRRHL